MGIFSKKSKAPAPSPKPPTPGAAVLAPDAQAARQLDLADGVLDGKFHGVPISRKPPPGSQNQSSPPGYGYPPNYGAPPTARDPLLPYGQPQYNQSYGTRLPSPNYGGWWDEPINPNNYLGEVISVEYFLHEPGWDGYRGLPSAPPQPYAPTYTTYGDSWSPSGVRPPTYGGYDGGYLQSYTQPSGYEEHYDTRLGAPYYGTPPYYGAPYPTQAVDPNSRPWFGVGLKWEDDMYNGGQRNVAVVHEVIPGSPAWKAGIQVGDQLEYWENMKIDSEPMWKSKVSQIHIGDLVIMGIRRNNRDQRVLVGIEGANGGPGPRNMMPYTPAGRV